MDGKTENFGRSEPVDHGKELRASPNNGAHVPIMLSVHHRADGTMSVSEIAGRQEPKLSQYHYSKLSPGNIRLLHLLPDADDKAPIQCQLFEYALQRTGERACLYEALSYCWGSLDKPYRAFIGDC
jgi:hypothetical protein